MAVVPNYPYVGNPPSVLSFCAGPVNWTMPTTWPFVITGLDLSEFAKALKPVSDFLQIILNTATMVTSPLYAILNPLLSIVQGILEATHLAYVPDVATLLAMLTQFTGYADSPEVKLSMTSTVGLANVGTQIVLGDETLDIWGGMVGGPPYPVTMPSDVYITSLEADFDALAVVNPAPLINIIPGMTALLDILNSIMGSVTGVLGSVSFLLRPILDALLSPLGLSSTKIPVVPSFPADMGFNGFAEGQEVRIVATLNRVSSILVPGTEVNMDPTVPNTFVPSPTQLENAHNDSSIVVTPIAKICVGGIELAHLAAWDATTMLPGTALSAVASVLGLNGTARDHNAAESGAFTAALVELPEPVLVKQGESLMVEFAIEATGDSIAVGIAAPNLSANVNYVPTDFIG